MAVRPAEALLLHAGPLRFGTDIILSGSTMCFAERVAAGNKRNRLLVIHRHAFERLANVLCCSARVRVAVRPLWVHVNQAHVVGTERSLEVSVGVVALIVEPRRLVAPVRLVRLPDVRASEGKTKGLESHRLQRAVAGEDEQVGPGELAGRTSA